MGPVECAEQHHRPRPIKRGGASGLGGSITSAASKACHDPALRLPQFILLGWAILTDQMSEACGCCPPGDVRQQRADRRADDHGTG